MQARSLEGAALVLLVTCGLARPAGESATRASSGVPTTVVLAGSHSPYRALGEEIAAVESVPLVESSASALALRPTFLLWVVAPTELSDQTVSAFNLAIDRASPRPSAGLITGSTLSSARDLYQRASRVEGDRAAVILGETAFTSGRITTSSDQRADRPELAGTVDVLRLLRGVDYVHYAGHGNSGCWRLLNSTQFCAYEVPPLPPLVVSTMSCQTTRLWEPGSIALRMVDKGAAAYSGFYYSPMVGFQIGEHDGPFRYTWPEVPLGHVMQAMNSGARNGYAAFTFDLLIGDPRVALRSIPPCRLVDHGESGGIRRLTCLNAPPGVVPLRIPGGAPFVFIEVAGKTSAWDSQPFYNRTIQMTTIGDDRIVLIEHSGGDLRLSLRRRPPVAWLTVRPLTDALDLLLISMADHRHGGDTIGALLAALAAVAAAWRLLRRKLALVYVVLPAVVGVTAALLHGLYAVARDGRIVVTGKSIVFSPVAAVATGLLVACGAFFYLSARTWRGRLFGAVIATSVGWVGGVVSLAITTVTNVEIASRTGISMWPYRMDGYLFLVTAIGCAGCALAFATARHLAAVSGILKKGVT